MVPGRVIGPGAAKTSCGTATVVSVLPSMDFNSVMQNMCLCFGNSSHLGAAARRGAAPALERKSAPEEIDLTMRLALNYH